MSSTPADLIICGGGIAGCVLASRLSKALPSLSVLLIEAGHDVTNREHVQKPLEAALLQRTEVDWNYTTAPQRHLDGKPRYNAGARALGGGSALNHGGWTRGDAADYDEWAALVGDSRWSYRGMLPYFKKTERHYDSGVDPATHGNDGPIHIESTSSSGRQFAYPLREPLKEAWATLGLPFNSDANSGHPRGVAELTENRRDGLRQLASTAYPLDAVEVMTGCIVQRIVVEEKDGLKVATGVELSNGKTIKAKKVVVSCGAYRTPQVLMLSGIGPAQHLDRFSIKAVLDAPGVGSNLHDHLRVARFWKLRHPERGLSLGTPLWTDPVYSKGMPMDWLVVDVVPTDGARAAGEQDPPELRPTKAALEPDRCHTELYVVYAALNAKAQGLDIPVDGTHIMTTAIGMLPTSRGTVRLASASAADNPVLDPDYYSTAFDQFVQRAGQTRLSKLLLGTPQGRDIVECEVPMHGSNPLGLEPSQEDVNALVRATGQTTYHPAGTAAMGSVVDGSLNVIGVEGLKVADASIIPVPIAAHYQACVYALAEQAADIILHEL